MLRDFGLVTVVDLSVALAGVMLVLPAALVWAEEGFHPLPALRRGSLADAARRAPAAPTRRPERWPDDDRKRSRGQAGGPRTSRRSLSRAKPSGSAGGTRAGRRAAWRARAGPGRAAATRVRRPRLRRPDPRRPAQPRQRRRRRDPARARDCRWPSFAVPDARAGIDADANVAQDDCESSRNPCPEDQRRTPACEIDRRRGRSASATSSTSRSRSRSGSPAAATASPPRTRSTQVASRFAGRVNFLSINVRDDPETVAGIVRDSGWDVPVGIDRDGAVSNLYRVGVCPTIFLAYPGGILYEEKIRPGNYDAAELSEPRRRPARGHPGTRRAGALMEGGAGTGPGSDDEQLATRGRVDPALREEFPGLYLRYLEVGRGSGRSPRSLRRRLATLSDRFAGAAGDHVPDQADPRGLSRLLSPHRPRPRRAADAGGGGRARADAEGRVRQQEQARRRADDRDDRVGSARPRPRRRSAHRDARDQADGRR